MALINICTLAETLAIPPSEMLDFSRHDASQLEVEQPRMPFGNRAGAGRQGQLSPAGQLCQATRREGWGRR